MIRTIRVAIARDSAPIAKPVVVSTSIVDRDLSMIPGGGPRVGLAAGTRCMLASQM